MENKDLIGRKVKGFAFQTTENIGFSDVMYDYINVAGEIRHYNEYNDSYNVGFDDADWQYPASEIEKHLVEEKDWSVNINSPTQQIDQDLLDKFALTALPAVIERVSINLTHEAVAQHAYGIAREMMKERSKNGN